MSASNRMLADDFSWKDAVQAATVVALPAYTAAPSTLTANANGAFPAQDGVTIAVAAATNPHNDRLLVTQVGVAAGADSGIYHLTQAGSVSTPWILTRTSDSDVGAGSLPKLRAGSTVLCFGGTLNARTEYILNTPNPVVPGVTALTWTQFTVAGSVPESVVTAIGQVLIGTAVGVVGVAGAGTSGQVLTSNGAGIAPSMQTAGTTTATIADLVYGDGSDGTVTLDGTTVIAGLTLTGGNLYTATREFLPDVAVINNGITLAMASFPVRGRTSITVNSGGTISNNGSAPAGAGAGASASNAAVLGSSGSGGAGVNTTTGGNPGVAAQDPALGGSGGASGLSGTAGGVATFSTKYGKPRSLVALSSALALGNGGTAKGYNAGAGGGGGLSLDAIATGGGGGGGAGIMLVATPVLVNNGTIAANGGNGGPATATGGVNAHGGGGGGGGAVILLGRTYSGSGIVTTTHGNGGAKLGTGTVGVVGSDGQIFAFFSAAVTTTGWVGTITTGVWT